MTQDAAEAVDHDTVLADPQHTEPATHSVLAQLREMIVTGEIPPDTRLRAEGLAAKLEVSRTPIRSALAVLSAEGLVNYSMNRGYTVRPVSLSDVFDSIEVRAALEGMAARASVEFGWGEEELSRITNAVRQGRAITERGDWSEAIEREWYGHNWTFHRTIYHASHNTVLRNAIRMTVIYPVFGDVVRLCPTVAAAVPPRLRQVSDVTPEHILASQNDHERVLDAIVRGDGAEAGRAMSEHVLATKRRLHAIATRR